MMLFVVGCSGENQEQSEQTKPSEEPVAVVEPVEADALAKNLRIPWAMNKRNDTFYLSERVGSVVKVENGGQTRQNVVLEKEIASTVPEAGLLGFVLATDFDHSQKAFAYYTYRENDQQFNRVVELSLNENEWHETKVLLDQIPSDRVHHGGRLALGPDGKLYATAGDASQPDLAQDLKSLAGKILRMNVDGSVPEDNPFPDSYVYSYGHRNPQGIGWAEDGTMYASEHGPNAHDEINVIEAGKNYGWPKIVGDQSLEGLEQPLFHSGSDTWAPSGLVVSEGKLYVATLRGNSVSEFDLETKTTNELVTGLGRIRDVWLEGSELYFVSNNTDGRGTPLEEDDKLYRVNLSALAE